MGNNQFINKDPKILKWIPLLILLLAIPAIIQANYALIFHLKASIISWLSIIICCSGLIINLLFPIESNPNYTIELLKNKYSAFYLIWTGIAVYTLSGPFTVLISIVLAFILEADYRKKSKTLILPPESKAVRFSWLRFPSSCSLPGSSKLKTCLKRDNLLWIAVAGAYLYLDLIREYTVWHEVRFRPIPTIIFGITLLTGLAIRISGREKD